MPIVVLSRRFERAYLAISREVQDRDGDLTTLVEEAATGIGVIKSFGRRRIVARASATSRPATLVELEQVRLRARFWTLID